MTYIHPTLIYRHRKENLKKCSLTGLSEKRPEIQFFTYPQEKLPETLNPNNYFTLDIDAKEELSIKDANLGIILIDGTWKYAQKISATLPKALIKRKLPKGFITAYPRKQTLCSLPEEGLASIEALYISYRLLGRDTEGLLDNYYWKDIFLNKNELIFSKLDVIINNNSFKQG